ncbi:uncharacterized protein LOC122255234 [Penaeus japonicus]|uniref:uncharacterized protein LOC122255234 n=1 Tax=Penaeus japonicus TaxID=27405 RepID=UPI001C713B58|nr:uncharacterized protein LOC122255234 [Penaeus japonicus]
MIHQKKRSREKTCVGDGTDGGLMCLMLLAINASSFQVCGERGWGMPHAMYKRRMLRQCGKLALQANALLTCKRSSSAQDSQLEDIAWLQGQPFLFHEPKLQHPAILATRLQDGYKMLASFLNQERTKRLD